MDVRALALPMVAGLAITWSAASSRAPVARIQEAPAKAQEEAGEPGHADTPLMLEMKKIETAEHFLKRAVLDPAQDAQSLEQIAIAEQACLAAKLLVPKVLATVPESERAQFHKDYRKGMASLLIEFLNLETALLDGDRDKARVLCRKLHELEESGHNTFTDGG